MTARLLLQAGAARCLMHRCTLQVLQRSLATTCRYWAREALGVQRSPALLFEALHALLRDDGWVGLGVGAVEGDLGGTRGVWRCSLDQGQELRAMQPMMAHRNAGQGESNVSANCIHQPPPRTLKLPPRQTKRMFGMRAHLRLGRVLLQLVKGTGTKGIRAHLQQTRQAGRFEQRRGYKTAQRAAASARAAPSTHQP